MNIARVEGGVNTAHDDFTTNTAIEVTHVTDFAAYVACTRRQSTETPRPSTRNFHDGCHACCASLTMALHKNASSTALFGRNNVVGQLAPSTTSFYDMSFVAHTWLAADPVSYDDDTRHKTIESLTPT